MRPFTLQVLCNKGDQTAAAKGPDRVKVILQKELEGLRKTAGTMGVAGFGDNDGDGAGSRVLGGSGGGAPYKFEDDGERTVTFASGSAKDPAAAGGVAAVVEFLEAVAA